MPPTQSVRATTATFEKRIPDMDVRLRPIVSLLLTHFLLLFFYLASIE